MKTFHKDGTLPQNNEIFVFGSNLIGIHGAGAAKAAYDQFGASWGQGFGLMGRSFAIPTKDKFIDTLPFDVVNSYIRSFVLITRSVAEGRQIDGLKKIGQAAYHFASDLDKDTKWFVTRVGCGLAGFKDSSIAPLFKNAVNCSFAEEWRQYVSD